MWAILFLIDSVCCVCGAICSIFQIEFWRPKVQYFIKLDSNGICIACLYCREQPDDTWLKVDRYYLGWLGKKFKEQNVACALPKGGA